MPMSGRSNSIGSGNTIVEFFSAEICDRVWRKEGMEAGGGRKGQEGRKARR